METREDPRNHWNLPVDVGTLSCRVSMMYLGVHMQENKDHLCHYTTVAKLMAVSRYPVPCLKNSLYKSPTRQSWVDICCDLAEEKPQSYSTKGLIMCIAFFQKEHVKQ